MCEKNSTGTERGDYIRLEYQSILEDIRFFKRQEWQVTNYALLVYGAIIAIAKICEFSSNMSLQILTVLVGVIAILLLSVTENSIEEQRECKREAMKEISKNMIGSSYFSEDNPEKTWKGIWLILRNAFSGLRKSEEKESKQPQNWFVSKLNFWTLLFVVIVGLILTWVVLSRLPHLSRTMIGHNCF